MDKPTDGITELLIAIILTAGFRRMRTQYHRTHPGRWCPITERAWFKVHGVALLAHLGLSS